MTNYNLTPNDIARFWSKVQLPSVIGGPDICWEWQAGSHTRGYGAFGAAGLNLRAHRVSHSIVNGPIPDGLCVCHSCDNPPCCNPAHLWLGTMRDNTLDMAKKGRHGMVVRPELVWRGEKATNAVLNDNIVRELRRLYKTGKYTYKHLSIMFGVGRGTVYRAINYQGWAHVK